MMYLFAKELHIPPREFRLMSIRDRQVLLGMLSGEHKGREIRRESQS